MPQLTKDILLAAIYRHHPKSLSVLRGLLKEDGVEFQDRELVRFLRELDAQGEITLVELKGQSFFRFLADNKQSFWLYLMVAVAFFQSLLVLYADQSGASALPRAVLGIFLLGFAPGYSLSRALFPKADLSILERVIISVFLSLIISIAIGTLLGAFVLFQAGLNVLLLSTATIIFALAGAYQTFRAIPDTGLSIEGKP